MSIPNLFKQTASLPLIFVKKFEKVAWNSIWSAVSAESKSTLVNCWMCCQLKENEGLGFRLLKDQNKAFLFKMGFGFKNCCILG